MAYNPEGDRRPVAARQQRASAVIVGAGLAGSLKGASR